MYPTLESVNIVLYIVAGILGFGVVTALAILFMVGRKEDEL